jgi:hypothetical protein
MSVDKELYEAWLLARAGYWATPMIGDSDTLRERRNEAFEAARAYYTATGKWPVALEVGKS